MTYDSDKVLERLNHLHPKVIDLSLGRLERLLAALDHPEQKLPPVIHVAGTNGKGSTTAYLRAILEAAGLKVHVYTSPHLVRFAERIRLAGRLIDEDHLLETLLRCEVANDHQPITYFEITTAAAFLAFHETPADVVLLEVGLGGRLDATNVIDAPLSTIITPVSLDHQAFLGNSLGEIATEKAGIAKKDTPLIIGPQEPESRSAILSAAEKCGADPKQFGLDWFIHKDTNDDHFTYGDAKGMLALPRPLLPGDHQIINAATAVACLRHQDQFDISPAAFSTGITTTRWPARLQNITSGNLGQGLPAGCELWLDGGHNPAAGSVLADALKGQNDKPLYLVCGMMANKDSRGYLAPLKPLCTHLYGVHVDGEDSHTADAITIMATDVGIPATAAASVRQAIAQIRQKADGRTSYRILICGSLYLSGQVLRDSDLLPD